MRLPHSDRLSVSRNKVVNYLLSSEHLQGRHKAAFFSAFGFSASNWKALAFALRRHGVENDVMRQEDTPFGVRYTVEGDLLCADDRRPRVRTIWFAGKGKSAPRLVTAYPLTRKPK